MEGEAKALNTKAAPDASSCTRTTGSPAIFTGKMFVSGKSTEPEGILPKDLFNRTSNFSVSTLPLHTILNLFESSIE